MIADFFEALTAYRAFDVCANGLLVGQAVAEPWPPYAPFVGRCGGLSGKGASAHVVNGVFRPAPVKGCDCGIHALKSLQAAEQRIQEENQGFFSVLWRDRVEGRAWGEVKIWGRIIEHEIGYRAEFAYPSSLFCEDEQMAARIAALYGVPCVHRVLKRVEPVIDSMRYWYSTLQPLNISPGLFTKPAKGFYVTSLDDDVAEQSMVTPAPKPTIPIGLIGASRWQQRQYAKAMADPKIALPDWRTMLRKMVYAQAIA